MAATSGIYRTHVKVILKNNKFHPLNIQFAWELDEKCPPFTIAINNLIQNPVFSMRNIQQPQKLNIWVGIDPTLTDIIENDQ